MAWPEGTPLANAARAISEARERIMSAICGLCGQRDIELPEGIELEPDNDSLGFALVLDYQTRMSAPDGIGEVVAEVIGPLLRELGVCTVRVFVPAVEEIEVKGPEET